MKRTISIMLCLLFLGGTTVLADEFFYKTTYDLYAGGYPDKHYTTHSVAAPAPVGCGIKIGNNYTELNNGTGYSHIKTVYSVSPYYMHTHYQYTY